MRASEHCGTAGRGRDRRRNGDRAATARLLAEKGLAVALVGRRRPLLEEVASDIEGASGRAYVLPADLAEKDAPPAIVEKTFEVFGRLDVLVNNAATIKTGALRTTRSTTSISTSPSMCAQFLPDPACTAAAARVWRRGDCQHQLRRRECGVGARHALYGMTRGRRRISLAGAPRMSWRRRGSELTASPRVPSRRLSTSCGRVRLRTPSATSCRGSRWGEWRSPRSSPTGSTSSSRRTPD